MGQPRPQMIAGAVQENLRLIFEPAKCARVNDASAVELKLSAITVALLGIFSAARVSRFLRELCEDSALGRLHFFACLPSHLLHRIIYWRSILALQIFRAMHAPLAWPATAAPADRRARARAR